MLRVYSKYLCRQSAAGGTGSGCGRTPAAFRDARPVTGNLYAADELGAVPEAAVLDLGSGGDIGVLLAVRRVGQSPAPAISGGSRD